MTTEPYGEEVGPGWTPIINLTHAKLRHLDPDYKIDQIKEKFGGLRYYFTPSVDFGSIVGQIMDDVVTAAEVRCSRTCEECGTPGEAHQIRGWWRTLCDEHAGVVRLEHSDETIVNTHDPEQCAHEHCTIHNMSEHHMRDWPQHWRSDRGLMERICPHGVGHPDPDEYKIHLNPAESIHGCDGCCGVPK